MLPDMRSLRRGLLWLTLALSVGACAGTPSLRPDAYSFGAAGADSTAFEGWFEASESDEIAQPTKYIILDGASAEQRFAAAEVAYFDGDIEHAANLYMQLLEQNPAHPLNRFGAARLYSLRHQVVDFHNRIRPILAQITFKDVGALTRVHLSQIGQSVAFHDWNISQDMHPFSGDALGFPSRWMTSPRLSNWRLSDFDTVFLPEQEAQLRPEYLAPTIAEDAPINYVSSRPYFAPGINLSPGFERSGLHYLETFIQVEPAGEPGARDYLLYANFSGATKLWINDTLVFERREKDYQSGERLRRIRLSPGEHRVLVKMANQRNYRDGFDLTFIGDDATPLGASGLRFIETSRQEGTSRVELLGDARLLAQLDPTQLAPEQISEAHDISLYLAANAAILNLQPADFDAAWGELMRRHPKFAVGYMLRARQLRTLWEVPSRIRSARSLADLRRASQLAPRSLSNNLMLAKRLREQGKSDEEMQDLLRNNRDMAFTQAGELRNIGALRQWASFLDEQGWSESAQTAWQRVLDASPTDCTAALSLQALYHARDFYPPPADITPAHAQCPGLAEAFANSRKDQGDLRLALARKDAARHPYQSAAQEHYSSELIAQGKPDRAYQVLLDARDRMPWDTGLWLALAKIALAQEGLDAARALLEGGIDQHRSSGWLRWRLAMLENKVPLAGLMRDGLQLAKDEVARGGEDALAPAGVTAAKTGGDEAYYLLDFAARKYFEDGSALTLTHNVIRVMTKGGIDRFGEFETPDGAELVLVRTIKQDGSVRIPEQTSGKSTLSMPGLAPGDFVEMAYLQYSSASALSKTRQQGIRFYFRMPHISSQHSEYIIVNPRGEFQRMHGAPEPQKIQTREGPAIQFLRTHSPRPRQEPSPVSPDEYLPWIQMHRTGTRVADFEAARRNIAEQIRDSSKMSEPLRAQIQQWRKDLQPGTEEEVKELFYRVSAWFADPTLNRYSTDATHALLEHDGNPLLVLKAAYDQAQIPAEIYLVRSVFQTPHEDQSGEFSKYNSPLMKVKMPDGTHAWVSPDSPDAYFNSPGQALLGQPAVCVSCQEARIERVEPEHARPASRHVAVRGALDAAGTLDATITVTYRGALGAVVRSVLRKNADPTSRQQFVDRTISALMAGATLQDFELDGLAERDQDMVIRATFQRTRFARPLTPDTLQLQTRLFDPGIAQSYAELFQRETPLFVPYFRDYDYVLQLDFPAHTRLELQSQAGSQEYNSEFGRFKRSTELDGQTLRLQSSIDMPIQRVAPEAYAKFRAWALDLDRSALLMLRVSR